MNAVDTNILLYSVDRRDPIKQVKAQAKLQALAIGIVPTVLPWQVIGELIQQLRRWRDLSLLTPVEFKKHLSSFRTTFPLILPDPSVVDHALDLADRFTLSHWDSMLLGACRAANVTTLFTEDMGAPRTIDTVQLINPLL
jgi:predicted nucleic acid-binding protein